MVLDINPIGRWALLNLIILPTRPAKSAAAYQKIWTDEGSPLRIHGEALVEALAERLGDDYAVAIGMRYGSGSIAEALDNSTRQGSMRSSCCPSTPSTPCHRRVLPSPNCTRLPQSAALSRRFG